MSDTAKKTASKKTTAQKRSEELDGNRPVDSSGLHGVSQDDLNPAFGPNAGEYAEKSAETAEKADKDSDA